VRHAALSPSVSLPSTLPCPVCLPPGHPLPCPALPCLPAARPPLALCPVPCGLQITGGMLNGVSPNYRDMAPALRAITSVSYNRHAASIAHSACTALLVLPWLASSVVQSLAPAPAAPLADACIAGWLAGWLACLWDLGVAGGL
jgi:hypothetical protein